jgi:hypothetical protein
MTKYSRHCLATLKYFCIKEEFDSITIVTCLQINLYLEQPMEVQLFATFLQRRK